MMFSKFGKVLTYRFHILLSKDKILSPTKVTRSSSLPKKPKKKALPKSILDKEMGSTTTEASKSTPKASSMFRSQSREEFYKSNSVKNATPPLGYYNCKYTCVSKSPKAVIFRKRAKSSSKLIKASNTTDTFSKHVPKQKNSSISFKKQVPRSDIFKNTLNDNRFVTYNCMPEICSNFKRIPTPDISKIKGRGSLIKEPEYCNSYNPDFKLVSQDLGKVPEFSKYPDRKPLFSEKEDTKNYDIH